MDQTLNRRLEIATARAEFLAGRAEVDEVRPVVAASWMRCRSAGVDALASTPSFHGDLDTGGRLVWAAQPIIDRLADESSELALSIALTDARSRLLVRVDTESRIGRLLDAVEFAPGFDYGEASMGTNGVGTAFESRQPLTIQGPEHFSERLQAFSCTGAPVRDPVSGRVEGVLDITCLFGDSTPILRSLVRSATNEIERNLLLERGQDQQAVFDAYLRLQVRSREPVGAVGLSVLLSSQSMHEQFSPQEREELRTHARYLVEDRDRAEDAVELASGTRARLRVQRVTVQDRLVGVAFEASCVRERQPAAGSAGVASAETLRTPGWRRATSEVTAALAAGHPLVAAGERGAGKATLVRDCFLSLHPEGRVVELLCETDASAIPADMGDVPTLVLIRRLDRWPAETAAAVERLADEVRHPHALAATFTAEDDIPHAEKLMAPFQASALVPPLRHRLQDLPAICEQLLHDSGRLRALSSSAARALAAAAWPGNLTELRDVLLLAAARRPTGPIEAYDLPPSFAPASSRRLTTMEQAERGAIVQALRDNDHNRLHAAEALGISRATLYRKLKQYGLSQ